jgi:hypothetical protein
MSPVTAPSDGDRRWYSALRQLRETGSADALAALFREEDSIIRFIDVSNDVADDIRAFLGDLVKAHAKRGKGRPSERHGGHERRLVTEVFAEWRSGRSKEEACAVIGARHGMTDGQILGIVNQYLKMGWSAKKWDEEWGRPFLPIKKMR